MLFGNYLCYEGARAAEEDLIYHKGGHCGGNYAKEGDNKVLNYEHTRNYDAGIDKQGHVGELDLREEFTDGVGDNINAAGGAICHKCDSYCKAYHCSANHCRKDESDLVGFAACIGNFCKIIAKKFEAEEPLNKMQTEGVNYGEKKGFCREGFAYENEAQEEENPGEEGYPKLGVEAGGNVQKDALEDDGDACNSSGNQAEISYKKLYCEGEDKCAGKYHKTLLCKLSKILLFDKIYDVFFADFSYHFFACSFLEKLPTFAGDLVCFIHCYEGFFVIFANYT